MCVFDRFARALSRMPDHLRHQINDSERHTFGVVPQLTQLLAGHVDKFIMWGLQVFEFGLLFFLGMHSRRDSLCIAHRDEPVKDETHGRERTSSKKIEKGLSLSTQIISQ